MKRIVFTVLITLWMVLNSFSLFAEEDEWTCSKCGKAASGNYCSNCGSEKPSGEWKCPNCGEVASGNFCSICGTSRVTTNLTEDGRMEGIEDDSPEEAMQVYLNAPNEGVATEPAAEEAALGSWENNLLMEEQGAQENTELSISNQKSLYAPVVDTILGSHPDAYFLHTDFNNDGTLELLIEYEPYASIAEGTEIELFTIVDGKCISTGGTSSSHSSYYDTESGEGLYAVSGIQGCETKMEIHMYNNEFSSTETTREIGDGSYYKNDNPVYMKPLSHFYNEQILPESADRYLSEDDVISLGQTGLELAKNEIYARHGRVFVTPYIEKYFRQQSWYQPMVQPEEFSDSVFNDYEAANIDFLVNEEAKRNEDYSAYDSDDTVLQYIPGGSSRAEDEYTDDELKLLALECYHQSYPEVIPDQISVSDGIANQVEVILWPPNRADGTVQAPYAYYEVDRFGIGTNRMDGNVFVNLSLYEYVLSE